jgi:hypothetical protein
MVDSTTKRTLYNWMMDGVISRATVQQLMDDGKVTSGKQKLQLVEYSSLVTWGVV